MILSIYKGNRLKLHEMSGFYVYNKSIDFVMKLLYDTSDISV